MTRHLLIIDPQNDFCDEHPDGFLPALAVKGASQDLLRLKQFIEKELSFFDEISVTLDSHSSFAIERPAFWKNKDGSDVMPFTFISFEDFKNGTYVLAEPQVESRVSQTLSNLGGIFIWPTHCVIGSKGHGVFEPLLQGLSKWETARFKQVSYFIKGEYPFTEHFGIFEAEFVFNDIPKTQYNEELYQKLTQNSDQEIYIAGQALSHCVAKSTRQLVYKMIDTNQKIKNRVFLLENCMSNVPGFEAQGESFLKEMVDLGVTLIKI